MEKKGIHSVEKVRDVLECPVCHFPLPSVFTTSIYQCDNGHIVHENCREKTKECSRCQIELRDQRSFVKKRMSSNESEDVSIFWNQIVNFIR